MGNTGIPNDVSGLQFIDLVRHHIRDILDKETRNSHMMYLYRTGIYWTAFERSAYRLEKLSGNVSIIPVRIFGISGTVVTAGIEDGCLDSVLEASECVENGRSVRTFRMQRKLDETAYHRWHIKNSAIIEQAMQEGKLFSHSGFPS